MKPAALLNAVAPLANIATAEGVKLASLQLLVQTLSSHAMVDRGGEWIENGSQQKTAWSVYETEIVNGMKASKFEIIPVEPGNVTSVNLVPIGGGLKVEFEFGPHVN
jgi:hypothetical protein